MFPLLAVAAAAPARLVAVGRLPSRVPQPLPLLGCLGIAVVGSQRLRQWLDAALLEHRHRRGDGPAVPGDSRAVTVGVGVGRRAVLSDPHQRKPLVWSEGSWEAEAEQP